MTDPNSNIQTKLIYSTKTTTEESRVNGNEYVVVTQQNANRTYSTTSSAHATPAITTVTDNATSVYSSRSSSACQTGPPQPQTVSYNNPTNVIPLTAFLAPNYTSLPPQPNCPNNYYPGPTPQSNHINNFPPQQLNPNNAQATPNYYVNFQSLQTETHAFTRVEVFHPVNVQPVIHTNFPQPIITDHSDNSLGTGAVGAIEQCRRTSAVSTSTDDMESEGCNCNNTKPKTENKFDFQAGGNQQESIGTQTPRAEGEIETVPEVELADEVREYINNYVDEYLKDEKSGVNDKETSLRDELKEFIEKAVDKSLKKQQETKAVAASMEEVKKCIEEAVWKFQSERVVAIINEGNGGKNIQKSTKPQIPKKKVHSEDVRQPTGTITINFMETPISSTCGGTRVDPLAGMNYLLFEKQLEEWYLDLEQTERLFINQVSETIRRDIILFTDKEKLTQLKNMLRWNKDFARDIEIEHDFIDCQHRLIDACISQFANLYDTVQFNSRDRRAILYNSVLNHATQKIIIRNDLELIIEMANVFIKECEANIKNSKTGQKNMLLQVIHILNIHMNTLQGIDKKVTILKNELILVSKMFQGNQGPAGSINLLKMLQDNKGPRISSLNLFKY